MTTLPYTVKKTAKNVLKVTMPNIKAGWEQYFLLSSDRHHDNPHCRRDLEYQDLNEVLKKKAGVIDVGDLFCAMQGKYDYRSDKSALRPEHQTEHYLDSLVSTTANDFEKYAKNIICFGHGNHETAILGRHETDLTQRLACVLNDRTGSEIQALGYTGWIKFAFESHSGNFSRNLWFTHGYGGGGPVTEDMIQSSRQRVFIENADIMVSGHVHRSWVQEYVKQRLTTAGAIQRRQGFYIKTPTYKDEYGDGLGGFAVTKGMGPRPLGAYWLRFYWKDKTIHMQVIKTETF